MPRSGYVIDSISFARDGHRLGGELAIATLPRLLEAVAESSGCVQFRLEGEQRIAEGLFLNVDVSAELVLQCQRCLEPMPYPVVFQRRFLLVVPGQEWPEDELVDDSVDAIEAGQSMDLVELLEQEILLSLPIAPRHGGECIGRGGDVEADGSHVFAGLAHLKRGA
jgi:uncharacterized protein